MKKYIIIFLTIFISKIVMSQTIAPHKGSIVKSDSIYVEMVFPKKNANCFQFYLYDNKMMQISNAGISGKVGFSFDKTGIAILSPKLKSLNEIFETCIEDWEEFYYCLFKLNINGKEIEFRFLNHKTPKPKTPKNNTQYQKSDGHSGHTH